MCDSTNEVVHFYQHYDEDNRMSRNPLEYLRCKEIISRYLANECLRIVDIGGATGAFSFWLASLGHSVDLVDITPKHIELAVQRQQELGVKLSSALVCDARQLPYENDSFDIVLLMGPLYHLQNKEDRIKCIQEAYRILKPNGVVLCEVISRYASMMDGFFCGLVKDPDFVDIFLRDIETGVHTDTSMSKQYFTDAYFHMPNEVHAELSEVGFHVEKLVAVTSFGHIIPGLDNKLKDENFRELLLKTIRLVETDAAIMGVSSHFIGIGKK